MTIQYNSTVRNLFMHMGVTKSLLGYSDTTAFQSGTTVTNRAITLYSGVQPSADTIVSNWTSYNTNFLVHWQNIPLYNYSPDLSYPVLTNSTLPAAVNATNSGTASWAIVWCGTPATGTGSGQIGNATIPTTGIFVVPVSDVFGNGVIKMSSLTITSGNPYMILDFAMRAGGL